MTSGEAPRPPKSQKSRTCAGNLDRTKFVGTMEISLLRASGGAAPDPDLRPALSALFDIIRTQTSIHVAQGVPAECIRPLNSH